MVQTDTFNRQMISVDTVSLLWFERLPSLPPRRIKESLRVLDEREMRAKRTVSSEGDDIILSIWYWRF